MLLARLSPRSGLAAASAAARARQRVSSSLVCPSGHNFPSSSSSSSLISILCDAHRYPSNRNRFYHHHHHYCRESDCKLEASSSSSSLLNSIISTRIRTMSTSSNNNTDMTNKSKDGNDENSNTNTSVPNKTEKNDEKIPDGFELIKEGATKMVYPKGRVVFYNPVQVQNRDLSVLMIALFAERRAKRLASIRKKKDLLRAARQAAADVNADNANDDDNTPKNNDKPTKKKQQRKESLSKEVVKEIEDKVQEYQTNTDWRQFVKCRSKHSNTTTDTDTDTDTDNMHNNDKDKDDESNSIQIPGITVLDALAASGLRSIRYWNEIPGVRSVTINDLDPAAVDLAMQNIRFNRLFHRLINDNNNNNNNNNNCNQNNNNCNHNKNNNNNNNTGIRVQIGDATSVLYNARRTPNLHTSTMTPTQAKQNDQYDVIDLDPYGSASPFIDGAVQAIANGGMLAITCTDMAALGGSHPETCYKRYGSMPIPQAGYLQELAVRILLYSIAISAARYGRIIKPVLSVGMHFYVRVFVEVWDDKAKVNDLSLNIGTVYQSTQCPSFHVVPHGKHSKHSTNIIQSCRAPLHPQCTETGGPFKTAGPIWIGPLHDMDVVTEAIHRLEEQNNNKNDEYKHNHNKNNPHLPTQPILATKKQLHGLLTVVSEELLSPPLYYTLPSLSRAVSCPQPPAKIVRAAIINAGYRVSAYHKEAQAIKTDAPNHVIWDIMRVWCKDHKKTTDANVTAADKNVQTGDGGGGGGNGGVSESKSARKKRKRREMLRETKRKKKMGEENVVDVNDKDNDNDNTIDASQDREARIAAKEGGAGDNDDGDGDDNMQQSKQPRVMSTADKILSVEPTTQVDFTIPKVMKQKKKVAQRFPLNPQANWGPKPMAIGYKNSKDDDSGNTGSR